MFHLSIDISSTQNEIAPAQSWAVPVFETLKIISVEGWIQRERSIIPKSVRPRLSVACLCTYENTGFFQLNMNKGGVRNIKGSRSLGWTLEISRERELLQIYVTRYFSTITGEIVAFTCGKNWNCESGTDIFCRDLDLFSIVQKVPNVFIYSYEDAHSFFPMRRKTIVLYIVFF